MYFLFLGIRKVTYIWKTVMYIYNKPNQITWKHGFEIGTGCSQYGFVGWNSKVITDKNHICKLLKFIKIIIIRVLPEK